MHVQIYDLEPYQICDLEPYQILNYVSMASHFTCSIWHGGLNTSRHASPLEGGSWDTVSKPKLCTDFFHCDVISKGIIYCVLMPQYCVVCLRKCWLERHWHIIIISIFKKIFFAYIAVMGKAEGGGEKWHGHVTALTVAPEFRRLGLAGKLMNNLEQISEQYVYNDNLFHITCVSNTD